MFDFDHKASFMGTLLFYWGGWRNNMYRVENSCCPWRRYPCTWPEYIETMIIASRAKSRGSFVKRSLARPLLIWIIIKKNTMFAHIRASVYVYIHLIRTIQKTLSIVFFFLITKCRIIFRPYSRGYSTSVWQNNNTVPSTKFLSSFLPTLLCHIHYNIYYHTVILVPFWTSFPYSLTHYKYLVKLVRD